MTAPCSGDGIAGLAEVPDVLAWSRPADGRAAWDSLAFPRGATSGPGPADGGEP
ncbi:hypothetical protein ACFFQW_06685 [Umezawaea endophytica]|uniref:Uncharacterized protein n=1 Tax=Umezawaea endophytica TaxID=1654476 RepID=A0A9X2VQJ0_9PSEU|nr:hypothetical protein [Umezawaea endophytica]MCS7480985.1 hypothetical protein [Umezawaea endophytica]